MDRSTIIPNKWKVIGIFCCFYMILACSPSRNLYKTPYIKIGEGIIKNITPQDSFRDITYRNIKGIVAASPPKGTFVANLCANRDGIIEVAEVDTLLTTYKEPGLLLELLHAVKGYRYEPDANAPPLHCGKLTVEISFDKDF